MKERNLVEEREEYEKLRPSVLRPAEASPSPGENSACPRRRRPPTLRPVPTMSKPAFFGGDATDLGHVRRLPQTSFRELVDQVLNLAVPLNVTREQYLAMPKGVAYGYFGELTCNALIAYQQAKGISPALGYFGSVTRASINGN